MARQKRHQQERKRSQKRVKMTGRREKIEKLATDGEDERKPADEMGVDAPNRSGRNGTPLVDAMHTLVDTNVPSKRDSLGRL